MKKGHRFSNPHIDNIKRTLLDVALWQLGFYNDKRIPKIAPKTFLYPNSKRQLRKKAPKVTWINHCTFLLSIDGLNLLTDPIWSDRCSPLPFLGPKRRHETPLALENLPHIDMVLISHDHYDHLDKQTVLGLHRQNPGITYFVPLGVKRWFYEQGIKQVVELDWWQEIKLGIQGQEVVITAVPAQHFSGRTILNKNRSLWVGFVIDFIRPKKREKRLYFVGDTGYNRKDFKKIGEKFGKMDLSLIPIGTYIPKNFMNPVHVSPKQSVTIHEEVRSRLSVGMHWKTFCLSGEELDQPPYDLYCALKRKGINPKTFRVLEIGQTINW